MPRECCTQVHKSDVVGQHNGSYPKTESVPLKVVFDLHQADRMLQFYVHTLFMINFFMIESCVQV